MSVSIIKLSLLLCWCCCFICLHCQPMASSRNGAQVSIQTGDARASGNRHQEAKFINRIQNQTVAIRRQAVFQCSLDNLANYKVAWLKVEPANNETTLLSVDEKLIVGADNNRFKVARVQLEDKSQQWRLYINNVQPNDRGYYMCQVSTKPVKYQLAYLDVQLPPRIVDASTSANLLQVDEFSTIEMHCQAHGYPKPDIEWRREVWLRNHTTGRPPGEWSKSLVSLARGDTLKLERVTRHEAGIYLCIASNKIPPAVSHRIRLRVNYGPLVRVKSKIMEGPLGEQVELECQIEGYPPASEIRWVRSQDQTELVGGSDKYDIRTVEHDDQTTDSPTNSDHFVDEGLIESQQSDNQQQQEQRYQQLTITISKLIIFNVEPTDYGSYQCVASNQLTNRDASIRLHEPKGRYLDSGTNNNIYKNNNNNSNNNNNDNDTRANNDNNNNDNDDDHYDREATKTKVSQGGSRTRKPPLNYTVVLGADSVGPNRHERIRGRHQSVAGQITLVSNAGAPFGRVALAPWQLVALCWLLLPISSLYL